MNDRLKFNVRIIQLIYNAAFQHPDWRFHQLLQNLEIEVNGEDKFYEESSDTLEKLENVINSTQQRKE
jgi:hypothetical protein